jgi:hypothetical protein
LVWQGFAMSKRKRGRPSETGVSPQNPVVRSPSNPWMRQIIPGCLLVLFVFLVYLPAMHGAFVWDDDSWTTNLLPFFHDFSGLGVIWIHPTAMQQYYPLTGTSFCMPHQRSSFGGCWFNSDCRAPGWRAPSSRFTR